MTQEHPITPPPELVQQWVSLACEYEGNETWIDLATQAARWGADQEIEACREWLIAHYWKAASEQLCAARRPKPPSLKEQALALISHDPENQPFLSEQGIAIIRRALESLPY